MKFRIVTDYDPETESYAAYCPELPGCCSCGETREEAVEHAAEAIALYLEHHPLDLKDNEQIHEIDFSA